MQGRSGPTVVAVCSLWMACQFIELFGHAPAASGSAPGRVNLMGDHTDYNAGLVLPLAIPQRTEVSVAPGDGRTVRVWSDQFADEGVVAYQLGEERPDGRWVDYVRGMTRVLAEAGLERGFDARIVSTVPLGSGLSSSASLEIALGRALRGLYALPIDDIALALSGRRAENEFVGAPVGIMDQMACSLADERAALFLDTRDLTFSRVTVPEGTALVILHSGISHRHASGGYADRRRECSEAAALLGVATLRDITEGHAARVSGLPPLLHRRVRHVSTENARVRATVEALRTADVAQAGRLFIESHASMRDDYAVSVPEIDALVEIVSALPGSYGARLTGGGFGGSVVALTEARAATRIAAEAVEAYRRSTGQQARVMVPA
jgi:galactokinase